MSECKSHEICYLRKTLECFLLYMMKVVEERQLTSAGDGDVFHVRAVVGCIQLQLRTREKIGLGSSALHVVHQDREVLYTTELFWIYHLSNNCRYSAVLVNLVPKQMRYWRAK